MIEGVLRYSSLDSYGQSKEKIQLTEMLSAIETDFEVLIRNKNATMQYDAAFPEFEGAPILVFQLFFNLINNALKFSRPGVAPIIEITGKTEQIDGHTYVTIAVRDNGIGFDDAYANRIFATFTRLHSKDDYEGTGLGLSLCKKIIDRHNGAIMATAAVNEGATFTVRFPMVQEKMLI
jgi:light-regulated signal transduction histidine kinase (bacteriophytochrome)